jgi:hypothetical protein
MSEYDELCSRIGKPAAERLVALGLINKPVLAVRHNAVAESPNNNDASNNLKIISSDRAAAPGRPLSRRPSQNESSELSSMNRRYTVVSLFSGAMGLDVGLDQTGRFQLLACVEKEKAFCDTIAANKASEALNPDLVIFHADISKLDPADVLAAIGLKPGELDILVGGPPCQSFSTAGRRGTVEDPRGTLLWETPSSSC